VVPFAGPEFHWHITRATGISVPHMIGLAILEAVIGPVIWLVSRRKGDRYTGRLLLPGLPGLYLTFLASMGRQNGCAFPA